MQKSNYRLPTTDKRKRGKGRCRMQLISQARKHKGLFRALVIVAVVALLSGGIAYANVPVVRLSTDPYTNTSSQHQTEVEPDTFAWGSTIVAAFQVGRFSDGGSSNLGWATSTNNGATWVNGFVPGTTIY